MRSSGTSRRCVSYALAGARVEMQLLRWITSEPLRRIANLHLPDGITPIISLVFLSAATYVAASHQNL